ncbi:response regulator transcription factor [Streptomyces sp. NPDC049585]|uniref:response regulator transcription factor n=1 Tax=Streptomyces sp. NPDC049585 TaxID=3155154 RepID=UPI003426A4B3
MPPIALTGRPAGPTAVGALRVVVDEPFALLRTGLLRTLADAGHTPLATGDDPGGALAATVAAHRPDVVVAAAGRLQEVVALRRERPATPVLVLSRRAEAHHVPQLLAAGGRGTGYLLHRRIGDEAEFLDALTRVARGGTVLDPDAVTRALRAHEAHDDLAQLSPREREVLALMAEGLSNAGIARSLVLSTATVEKRVAGVFAKLGLEPDGVANRRVLAVLRYLRAAGDCGSSSTCAIRSAPRCALTSTGAVPSTARVAR